MPSDRPLDARTPDPACSLLVEVFNAATVTTFEELCQTPVVPGDPYVTQTGHSIDQVTAEITLRRAVPGRQIVAFPRSVLETLAGRYLPTGEPLTPDILDDVAGEFANVIAGQAKTMLKGTQYHFNLSTPRLGHILSTSNDGTEFLVLPFDSDPGGFRVCIQLLPCEESETIV